MKEIKFKALKWMMIQMDKIRKLNYMKNKKKDKRANKKLKMKYK